MPATAMILSSPQCLQRGELFRQRPQPATCLRSQHRVPILLHDRGERRRRARNGGDRAHAKAAGGEGSARVSRAGVGVAPKRTFLDLITIRTVRTGSSTFRPLHLSCGPLAEKKSCKIMKHCHKIYFSN